MTRRWMRLAVGGGLAAGLLLASPVAASSTTADPQPQPQGKFADIRNEGGELKLVFQTDNLPKGTAVDPESVHLSIGGQPVTADVARLGDGPTASPRTAVLAMDVSHSMGKDGLDAAKAAAKQFVDGLPEGVDIGLVSFSTGADTEIDLTQNKQDVKDAIDRLELQTKENGTALYDAVAAATDLAGDEGPRNVVLLTDGEEHGPNGSEIDESDAIAAVNDAGVALNGVFFGKPDEPGAKALDNLVGAAGGTVVAGDSELLAEEFANIAAAISEQLQITAKVPPTFAGTTANVEVTAKAGDLPVGASAAQLFPVARASDSLAGPRPVTVSRWGTLVPERMLPVALGIFFLGLLIVSAFALNAVGPGDARRGRLRRRLSVYTLSGKAAAPKPVESTALGSSHVARSAVEFAGKVVQRRDFETALDERLEAGGVPLRPAEWMLIHVGITIGAALLLLLISGGKLLPALIGLVLGVSLPWFYLSSKESRRKSAFMSQLPDTLQLVAGSLSAGYSMPQALDTVVREGQQPMTGEFNRALVEARLGVPVEDALDGVAARMRSQDFAWVVMAIRIQREVGGNLAELLTTVSATMRERERLRRQVQVLSAEGRLSAWILGLLPVVFTVYLVFVRPTYLEPLYTEPIGVIMSVIGLILLIIGVLWMRRSVRVEV